MVNKPSGSNTGKSDQSASKKPSKVEQVVEQTKQKVHDTVNKKK